MQDIDFDELDRAVSSTLKPGAKTENKTDDTSVAVNVTRSQPAASDAAPAARRSSGRFMDVVHPSSDMRSSSTPPARSEPRESEPPELKPVTPPTSSDTDWPDPLDFHGFKDDEATPAPDESKDDDAVKPLESPFLSDAKVEKRPLGAFSTDEAPTTDMTPPEEAPEKDETPLLEAPDEELLPAEIEKEDEPAEPETSSEPAPADEPIGPTSITQQYKEQPSTTDQPSGAIYDTEAYHQALSHPEKKRSGALVIVWIVGLIILGTGVGAGIYFFVLPML